MARNTSANNHFASNQKLIIKNNASINNENSNTNMSRTIDILNAKNNSSLKLLNNDNTNISMNSLVDLGNVTNPYLKNNKSLKAFSTTNRFKKVINIRPLSTATKINIDKINFYKKSDVPSHLDVLNLILKNSPERIDMKLVAQKMTLLNKEFKNKRLNSTSKRFYEYNVLYGYKTNNIIKSYTPKLVLQRPSKKQRVNQNGQEMEQVLNEDEISSLFYQKCIDLNIPLKEELLNRFTDYLKLKCVNRVIDLTDCKLGLNSMVVLSEIIKRNENKYSRLILSKNNFGDKGLELLLDSIQDNNGIVELNLSSNSITAKGGKMLFTYLLNQASIISLDLSSHEGINRNRICCEGVKLIENVLKTNFFIENLDLSSNSIKTEGFKYLINGLKGNIVLKNLNVSNNEIDEKGIYYMNENLINCKIEIIDLSSNPIGNDGCISFGKCLGGEKLTEITSVNLSDCSIRFHGIREFLKNMRKNKKINNLLLDKNNLYSKNWFYLEDYLLNLNLRNLGLSSCSLSMAAAEVSKIFQHHPTLKALDLSHNQINDNSFIYFKTFPKENLSLVEIDLSRNYISDKSAKYFFENLINNRSLQRLNFFDNQLQNESANAVIESLKINHFITYINFKANRVPIRIMKEINLRIQNNKIIEKEKFLPQLKCEIKDLSFDPEEINSLKGRIILQNQEKEIFIQKLKEDSKIIKMKKLENEKELNKVESESNNILSKIDIISKEIRKIIEMRESEVDNYKAESDKIEENITAITNELDVLKIENYRQQNKYDDINKKFKKIYDNTYKKYEEQRKFLMLEIDQLKSKKKKYVSKLRIVEKLKNLNKDENKVDETSKSINSENLLNQKEHNIIENNMNSNEKNKSLSTSNEKPKLKKKKNSSSFLRKIEKSKK